MKLHFMGIGGVGMAALAVLAKARGDDVSGCDVGCGARTAWLGSEGIKVFTGHDSAHLKGVDEVIVTPAVNVENPELKYAKNLGIRVRYRGEVLAELASARDTIAVCGSHGKTTTSTFIAKLLTALGEDTAWAIGGETGVMPVARAGNGPLVVEADESDGTLALYHAKTLVVNKCEYDHPDYFKSEADYFACFEKAKANADDVIDAQELDLSGWNLPVAGAHNKRNARAAIEVALRRGYDRAAIEAVLPGVLAELPDRRFELLAPGVYTDYAHHPTEMKNAIQMAREVCRGKLRVLFQPHRYSRTKALINDFPSAFADADETIICPTYAAFESPVEGGDEADLYAACRAAGINVYLSRSCEEAWTHAKLSSAKDDVVLLLGAGDIIALSPMVREGRVAQERRIYLGMGTNTWRSDLQCNEVYVKTEGPAGRPGAELGIPWMAGIPGTVGGWVKMNAGAFGHSISELILKVKVDGEWRDAAECGFGYRKSTIDGEIQDVILKPYARDLTAAQEFMARRAKFPPGTRGSVFKNPEGDFAGRLLEAAGAKELRVGGAYVWENHANVIVEGEGSRACDFLALARLMRQRVKLRLGVDLQPEVCGI